MPGIAWSELDVLGFGAEVEADLNLTLHIVIVGLIVSGYTYARRRKINVHEKWMLPAIILAGISLFAWMLRSYIRSFDIVVSELYTPGVMITNLHVVFGIVTGTLAIYILLLMKTEWLPERIATTKVKQLMRTTFTLWWCAFLLGVAFYVWYYVIV
jgi:uncharacterized membrane protein YozB (DUF420 family)